MSDGQPQTPDLDGPLRVLCPTCRGRVTAPVSASLTAVRTCSGDCVSGRITVYYQASHADRQTHVVRLGGDPRTSASLCGGTIGDDERARPGTYPPCLACLQTLADIQPATAHRAEWPT